MIAVLSRPTHQHRPSMSGWHMAKLAAALVPTSWWWHLLWILLVWLAATNAYRALSFDKRIAVQSVLQHLWSLTWASCSTAFAAASLAPPTTPTPPGWHMAKLAAALVPTSWWWHLLWILLVWLAATNAYRALSFDKRIAVQSVLQHLWSLT